ncbi:MAG: LysM peptidoglycan-binding domain-containing protein [Chitinophagales bacterium]
MCALPAPPPCPQRPIHTVARGETLYLLARRYGTTVAALQGANPQLTNPNVLAIGQQLCIPPMTPPPPGTPTPPACPSGVFRTVVAGETLWEISAGYGATVEQFRRVNPQIGTGTTIYPGQRLCVPEEFAVPTAPSPVGPEPPDCRGGTLAIVKAGDTLTGLATRFGVELSAIIRANPQITDPNVLVVGQYVCIPLGLSTGPGPVV